MGNPVSHTTEQCTADNIDHMTEGVYRDHEILVRKCNNCPNFIIDVRADNNDGEFLAGYITNDLVGGMFDAFMAVDKHEADKKLLMHIPF